MALPFVVVMVGLAVSLTKDLRSDPMVLRSVVATEAVEQAVVHGLQTHGDDFVLTVQHAPDEDGDGVADGPTPSRTVQARTGRPSSPGDVQPLAVDEPVGAGRPQEPRD